MIRYSEKDFINEIKLMVSNNASEQEISYRALELMNSSIDWREEFRDFALDLISIIEPGFYMTNDEILENINLLGKKYYPWNEYWKISPQDSARLLTRACIELKNKQTEVVNENSKNMNCEIDVLGTR